MYETTQEISSKIVLWIQENMYGEGIWITPDSQLIAEGLLDSMEFLRLTAYLEEAFEISLDPDLLAPENFESPNKVAALVARIKHG